MCVCWRQRCFLSKVPFHPLNSFRRWRTRNFRKHFVIFHFYARFDNFQSVQWSGQYSPLTMPVNTQNHPYHMLLLLPACPLSRESSGIQSIALNIGTCSASTSTPSSSSVCCCNRITRMVMRMTKVCLRRSVPCLFVQLLWSVNKYANWKSEYSLWTPPRWAFGSCFPIPIIIHSRHSVWVQLFFTHSIVG